MPSDSKSSAKFDKQLVITYIERHWIQPRANSTEIDLDAEDEARIALIQDLQALFGVNDEAIPIILDLVDQIHRMRFLIQKSVNES